MRVNGMKHVQTGLAATYELLNNPDAIVRAMPGLKSMKQKTSTSYDAEIEVGVAGIKGSYLGTIEMKDVSPPNQYTLAIKGEGPMGFMESEVVIRLTEAGDGGTDVSYDGDAKVGGTVAGVGQRVLAGVAKLLINQFFNGIAKEAKGHAKG